MRSFLVNVNGTQYQIEVEEIEAGSKAAAPKAEPVKAAPKAEPAAAVSTGSTAVNSPMPGNILSVNVAVGDTVKAGQVLMVLEAMKMENEILAPKAGKVAAVNVAKGVAVSAGQVLCSID